MKPSLLILHNRYRTPGGEERLVNQQVELFRRQGHEVHLYTEDSARVAQYPFLQRLWKGMQVPFSFPHYWKLRRTLQKVRPSIVHIHNIFPFLTPSVYYAAAAERVPIIQSVHNYRFLCSNGLFLLPNGAICERCIHGAHWNALRRACVGNQRWPSAVVAASLTLHQSLRTFTRKIHAFTTTSKFLKQKLMEGGFPAERIHQIPPYFDPLSKRSVEPGPGTLLFVGRLSREKGLWTLLESAARLPEWKIQVAGQGPLESELRSAALSRQLTNVEILGNVSFAELELLLQRATLLVVPSECYENLPTVILEAWFYGLPVAASRLGGMAEIVREGETGVLFTPGRAASLAAAIRSLSSERIQAMRKTIAGFFERRYGTEASYPPLMALYEDVLARHRAGL